METDIKFRGKRVDNEEWVEGGYFGVDEDGDALHTFILTNCQTRDFTSEHSVFTGHKVDKKTVGQFTGLQDKNGVEIYEGDIFHLGDKNIIYAVVWHDTGLRGQENGTSNYVGLEHWRGLIGIIGNIYDNPELLEL